MDIEQMIKSPSRLYVFTKNTGSNLTWDSLK